MKAVPVGSTRKASKTVRDQSTQAEYRPFENLVPFARNPRIHSDEQVA